MNIRRMEGEVVRDCILFLAGRLDTQYRWARPARGLCRVRYPPDDLLPLRQRRQAFRLLDMFDAANVTECYRRHETIVPQQALALTNSGMVLTRAGDIASTIDREVGGGVSARGAFVDSAFERILGRAPTEAERTECAAGLARLAEAFAPRARTVPRRKPGPARRWSTCS